MGRLENLRDRGEMLAKARAFFAQRGVLEVDCPAMNRRADIAAHIDLITATYQKSETCYLHPSAEYGMKRLISEGIGDIYQLSHVFRDGEWSHKHHPEFTLVEWYRHDLSFVELIEEALDFIRLFLGGLPGRVISYREAFLRYAGIDYETHDLLAFLEERGIETSDREKDALLNIILGIVIEPQLGIDELCVLAYYPSAQAALAKTLELNGEVVAERFEVYYKGVELCNGYHELTDPVEQRRRIHEANRERLKMGKEALPVDEAFLAALERGMPDTCGVAVGFDRLMMLRHQTDQIADVLPFTL